MKNLEKDEKKLLKELGKSLSEICSKKGRSLERVAYEAGISKSYIYDIANGKANPSIITIYRIATALEIPVWKFLKDVYKYQRLFEQHYPS